MITAGWYKVISDLINFAQARGYYMVSNLNDMATYLDNNEVSDSDITKKRFYNTIVAKSKDLDKTYYNGYSYEILNFVKNLQVYVNEKYSSVNDFLSDNDTKVFPTFAAISAEVGFPIDGNNIIAKPIS